MDIIISNASDRPIYEQIATQIQTAILNGSLPAGQALPSIRALAKDLRISVITTKRAYDELEKEGFLCTVAGKGSYVAPQNTQLMREANLRKIEEYMQKIWQLAAACGLDEAELGEMLCAMREENADGCN